MFRLNHDMRQKLSFWYDDPLYLGAQLQSPNNMIVTVKGLSCKAYHYHTFIFSYNLTYPKIALPQPPIITHLTFGILVDALVPFVTSTRDAAVWFWTKVWTWTFQNWTEVQSKVRWLCRTGPQVQFWVQTRFKISEPGWTWFKPNFFFDVYFIHLPIWKTKFCFVCHGCVQ